MSTCSLEFLTEDQIVKFHRDGYLCLSEFLTPEETIVLLDHSKQLLREFDLASHPRTKFTTSDDHVGDEYFLSSGDKIRFFLEEDAVNNDGSLNRPKDEAVNKIGHGLHVLDPVFRRVTLENERLKSLVRDLRYHDDPQVLQSMVICKQRKVGGEVPEHNDSTFLYTDPPSALGFWFALEKCTAHNGALSFLPGSHLTSPITKRFVRAPSGGTTFNTLQTDVKPKAEGEYILETCEPGDLVLIHGNVLHKSERNTSSSTRFAYTFHMIEGPAKAVYDEKNWLQPTAAVPFTRLFANV
ncbi:phytanoyl-CoA dioxygenase [Gautieria morchelliformis]|nr:phytanoyl-CoA dioxygenase [Gautieria morchelliformis]